MPTTKSKPESTKATAKVFRCGNSQAIRIPRDFRTDVKEFTIHRLGNGGFCLYPTKDQWFLMKQCVKELRNTPGLERNQPLLSDLPEREAF